MKEPLPLSIFAIEADLKPVLAVAAKRYEEAEVFFSDERVQTKLRSASFGGVPLCDDHTILRIRLANTDERARYREPAAVLRRGTQLQSFWWMSINWRSPGTVKARQKPSVVSGRSQRRLFRCELWLGHPGGRYLSVN